MGRYLVQTIHSDHFNSDILVIVYEVLKLIEDIDFGVGICMSFSDENLFLNEALMESLKHLEKAKKYLRDYPSRPIDSLYGYIKPLKMISEVFDLSDSYEILEKKLGSRYPEGFNIRGTR